MQHWIVFLHILHVQLNQCGLALQWRTVIHDGHPLADAAASANSGVLLLDDECLLLFEAPKIQLRIIPFPWLLELNGHGARLAVLREQFSKVADATHPRPLVLPVRALPLLFFSDVATVFPQIDISVGIYLYVLPVGSEQQVQDMVAVELRDPAPTVAAILATLHLLVIVGVDSIDECPHSYLICHN